MSAAGKALSLALNKPEDWLRADSYKIIHKPTGLSFWIANGSFFFDGNDLLGTPKCLGLLERHWLYYKAMRCFKKPMRNGNKLVAMRFSEVRR